MNKKSVSNIIVTLLLIVLSMAVLSLIAMFIVPAVKEYLNEGKTCLDVIGKIEIYNNELTCYNDTSGETGVNIKRKDIDIETIIVSLKGEAKSKKFEINEGEEPGEIKMLYDREALIELPEKNEERTYVFNTDFEVQRAVIAVRNNGVSCEAGEEIDIKKC
jgi:hypothetical protein